MNIWFHQHQMPTLKIQVDRSELITDSSGKSGLPKEEERTIRTQRSKALSHVFVTESQSEFFVHQPHREGGIRRASSQTCAGRNMLIEVDIEGWQLEILFEEGNSTEYKIILWSAVQWCSSLTEVMSRSGCGRRLWGQRGDFEGILQRYRIEYGFNVMITVGTAGYNI